MIDFPANPTVGQQFTSGGVTWTWDGVKWTAGAGVAYLPLAGGTMLGPIVLAADPAAALQPATKQYVDGGRLGDNRIINGDMRIDQRFNGAVIAGAINGIYTCDRWWYNATAGGAGWGQAQRLGTGSPPGFGYNLQFKSLTAHTIAAGDQCFLAQAIEADQVTDFQWGTSNAQPVTLQFLVQSSVAGSFGGAILNYAGTRSYPFSYNIPTANAWTKIVITIPGDTGGTWVMGGNGGSLNVIFDLGSGTNYRGPANTWAATTYLGVTGAQSIVAVNGATFNVTGVKLEIGSIATPFNRQSLAKSLADCQRYYQSFANYGLAGQAAAAAGALGFSSMTLPVQMRVAPTVVFNNITYVNASALAANVTDIASIRLQCALSAAGAFVAQANPLTLSAEL